MTVKEILYNVREAEKGTALVSAETLNSLVNFYWDYDAFGILDTYGHIDDEGVREQVREEIICRLDSDISIVVDELIFAIGEDRFNEDY